MNKWSSYFGFILAVAGAAIGLGNIWRFPYMVGEQGGSAFVLCYIFFMLVLGLPMMVAEMSLGRFGVSDPVAGFKYIIKQFDLSRFFSITGWLMLASCILILSFYIVIAGLACAYLYKSMHSINYFIDAHAVANTWDTMMHAPSVLVKWTIIFFAIGLTVVSFGVQKGLERMNILLMPALYGILICLLIYCSLIPGFYPAVKYMFGFRFADLSWSIVLSAMGHAFFSLAIGAGCLLTYGSYLVTNNAITRSAWLVSIMSILVAMMSGLCIYSITFSYGLSGKYGAGLMFQTLPLAFGEMFYGQYIGIAFFSILVFAALTSAISFIEVLVAFFVKNYHLSRRVSILWIAGITMPFSWATIISLTTEELSNSMNFFSIVNLLINSVLLPVTVLLIAAILGWLIPTDTQRQWKLFKNDNLFFAWHFSIKYLVPLAIGTTIILQIINQL